MDKEFYNWLKTESGRLVKEKGFEEISVEQIFSRIYSEVGEAINAYKKDNGELAEELADVTIYLFNYVNRVNFLGCYAHKDTGSYLEKWGLFNNIMRKAVLLQNKTHLISNGDQGKKFVKLAINDLLGAIEKAAYAFDIDLEEAIKNKMEKNFKREYRYNSSANCFSAK